MKNLESWAKWRMKIFMFGIPVFFISLSLLKSLIKLLIRFLRGI